MSTDSPNENYALTSDQHNYYDALKTLNDFNWNEFKEKTKLEWRFSFGIWAGYSAILTAYLSKIIKFEVSFIFYLIYIIILAVIIGFHFGFLYWIQKKLRTYRYNMIIVQKKMTDLLKLTLIPPSKPSVNEQNEISCKEIMKRITIWIQITISILLSLIIGLLPKIQFQNIQ
jgi:hypothetical protein